MPRILGQTPSWLSRPSPGYDLFSHRKSAKPIVSTGGEKPGCSRTIACRGSEVFVAADKEVRWSDLTLLKEEWRQNPDVTSTAFDQEDHTTSNGQPTAYKVLEVSAPDRIRQLSISPRGNYLAIATSYGLRIAVLPAQYHLSAPDAGPIRLSSFQVGSTAHVVERSPLAAVLWHPLSHEGNCLVTITQDAVVRLWELDRKSRGTFDSPSWAVDLKKLADGSTSAEDYTPSKYRSNEGFSPDAVEMEVVAACFGGSGAENQAAWSAMTLWIAMKYGDIYALCPILPSKFRLSDSRVSDLAESISIKYAVDSTETHDSSTARQKSSQQASWIADILEQQEPHNDESDRNGVYHRPSRPSALPKLQGPSRIRPDLGSGFEITDIYSIPQTVGDADYSQDNGSDLDEHIATDYMPIDMLCVATIDSKIHLLLPCDAPEGHWLPPPKSRKKTQLPLPHRDMPELLYLETLTMSQVKKNWLMFSADVESSTSLFVTHASGVSHFSVSRWAEELANESSADANDGSDFRIDLMVNAFYTRPQQVLCLPEGTLLEYVKDGKKEKEALRVPPACVAVSHSDLGSLVITMNPTHEEPQAVELDLFDPEGYLERDVFDVDGDDDFALFIPQEVLRDIYQPAPEFYGNTNIEEVLDQQVGGIQLRTSRSYKDQVKMSDRTLKTLMDVHRLLRTETHAVAEAASELFRRCERLRSEFKEQIEKADKIARRTETMCDDYADIYEERQNRDDNHEKIEQDNVGTSSSASVGRRIETARERQDSILERYTALRRRVQSSTLVQGKPISEREAVWMDEVGRMEDLILCSGGSLFAKEDGDASSATNNLIDTSSGMTNGAKTTSTSANEDHKPWQRYEGLRSLRDQLVTQSIGLIGESNGSEAPQEEKAVSNGWSPQKIQNDRRVRPEQVRAMLERESALVEAAMEKLNSLSSEVGG